MYVDILCIDSPIADKIEKVFDKKHGEIILQPRPTTDPNDPLNWPKWYALYHSLSLCHICWSSTMALMVYRYKAWNFTLVCLYTLLVFVNVDIGTVIWGDLIVDLGFSVQDLTWSFGFNTAGLAVGCILFIPFALKYGRRVMYVVSYPRLSILH